MKGILSLLFISFVFSKDLVVTLIEDDDRNAVKFIKLEFEKCYRTSSINSFYLTHEGNSVTCKTYLSTGDCSGLLSTSFTADLNDRKIKKFLCSSSGDNEQCSLEIKRAPRHNGFYSLFSDDSTCSHRDNTTRIYVTNKKYKCDTIKGYYCKYEEEDNVMYFDTYPNNNMKKDERISHTKSWNCDVCENGIMYQCEAVSIVIVSALFILAIFF
ncbi:hypothetical protein EDI_105270 [Entamoeba dispar SAW760]|uniref:Uncharacterized protein n=1 Tax=Entamoeba dispar (strain ATCC PRA-260 / SAW760) TaxID=370354 RepID=B0E7V5_ENTDS|nr:uncharacterized protein EDI_105270 [Entamoeba dispar SAW760]EDR29392.1 hypothetical protein EDI_105270 [Entamoeba dispar SAW760]|eukprot:EDR29392.1 hypothetical protein EDI_105270 [Entamoeba dispar SAW760]